MSVLTLVVHDPLDPVSQLTVGLLADWSAAGWLEGYALLSVAEIHRRGEALGQNLVVVPPSPSAPQQVVALSRLVEGRPVRVVVLDPIGWDATWLDARTQRHLAGKLLFDRLPRRVGAMDVLITWHGGHWDPTLPAWPGWDTLIAAPQEGESPANAGFDLHCRPDDPARIQEVAAHAAAFTATVAALWVGVGATPWDHTHTRDDVLMARAFHVRLDGSEVLDLVWDAALSPAALRAPGTVPASRSAAFAGRIQDLRDRLSLEPPPRVARASEAEEVGALAAITMFFSFLWRALVMAPSELSKVLMHRGKSTAAGRLTNAIFGQASSKRVTVAGIPARSGSREALRWATASEESIEHILDQLRRLDLELAPTSPPSGQESFWRATIDTVLALASGERQRGIEPVVDEGVPRWYPIDQLAPSRVQTWRPVNGITLATVTDELAVNDLRRCDDALAELGELSRVEGLGSDDVERNRRDLQRAAQHWRASFLGSVGEMLVGEINQFRDRVQERMDQLSQASAPPTREAEDLAGELSHFTKVATLVALGVGAVLGLLDWIDVLPWSAWWWVPTLVLVWFLTLVGKYLSVQRRVFQLIHRARDEESLVARLEREIPVLIENLHRLHRVYSQYLAWSRLLPVFLNEPFGRARSTAPRVTRLVGNVPPSVTFGRYEPRDREAARDEVSSLAWSRRTTVGRAWSDFLGESFAVLAKRPEFLAQVPEDVCALEDVRLQLWLAAISEPDEFGLRLATPVAEGLILRHTADLIERSGHASLDALIRGAFDVVSVEGRVLPDVGRSGQPPADFSTSAFSLRGLGRELTRAEEDLAARMAGSGDLLDPRHVLDEVTSILISTRPLTMADVDLKQDRGDESEPEVAPVSTGVRF